MKYGKKFGQKVSVINTIKRLIKDYPKGVGIFKEYIQNADDAGATEIIFLIDERNYPVGNMPSEMHWLHKVPALLIYNNRPFTDNDLNGIQQLHVGSKIETASSVGRYGVGFNSSYNVTDVPYFLTNNTVFLFDPNCKTLPDIEATEPGMSLTLDECAAQNFPFRDSFNFFDELKENETGTIFRLPFRTKGLSPASELSGEDFTIQNALDGIHFLSEYGASILLFLKNVTSVRVYHRTKKGITNQLLSVLCKNPDTIHEARLKTNEILNSHSQIELFDLLEKKGSIYSQSVQEFEFTYLDKTKCETWAIVNGLFNDYRNEICTIGKRLLQNKDKAIPIAGVAFRLDGEDTEEKNYYCALPLPVKSKLPVRINAFFDLDSSRQSIGLDLQSTGNAKDRVLWNRHLLEIITPMAYVVLIEFIKDKIGLSEPQKYYKSFPNAGDLLADQLILAGTYTLLSTKKVIKTCNEGNWVSIRDVRILPSRLKDLQADFEEDKLVPIPVPALTGHIIDGFGKEKVIELRKDELIKALRIDHDLDVKFDDAPFRVLNTKEKVEIIFRFVAAYTTSGKELNKLPILIDSRGHLRTIGFAKLYLLSENEDELDRSVFIDYDEFLISKFTAELVFTYINLTHSLACITIISNYNYVKILYQYLQTTSHFGNEVISDLGLYSKNWIECVFKRLDETSDLADFDFLAKNLKIVPTSKGKLTTYSNKSLVILQANTQPKLIQILEYFGAIYTEKTDGRLVDLILRIHKKYTIGERLSAKFIVDIISSKQNFISTVLKKDDFQAVFNFLSQPNQIKSLAEDHDIKSQLTNLPIFPTSDGRFIELTEANLYVTNTEDIPDVPFRSSIILAMDNQIELFEELRLKCCSVPHLVSQELIPDYDRFSEQDQLQILKFIRGKFSELKLIIPNFKSILYDTCLIRDNTGELARPSDMLLFHSELSEKLFGSAALVPDYENTYSADQIGWEDFFKDIGIKSEPSTKQLVDHISYLVTSTDSEGSKDSVLEIIKYFDSKYISNEYRQINPEDDEQLIRLRQIEWVPVLKSSDKILGFVDEETEYETPENIYLYDYGTLIGSRYSVALFRKRDIESKSAEFYGFNDKPPISDVITHFDTVIDIVAENSFVNTKPKSVKRQFDDFYEYFGDLDDDELDEVEETGFPNHYNDNLCIWHDETQSLIKPNQSFKSKVKYLKPYAYIVESKNAKINKGLDLLGRRDEPDVEFIIDTLRNLAVDCPEPTSDEIESVTKIYSQLVETVLKNEDTLSSTISIPVLIRDGLFKPSSSVYIDDAPNYQQYSANWGIAYLHSGLAKIPKLDRILGIKSLSESVVEDYRPASNNTGTTLLTLETDWIQSEEFLKALKRLAYHCGVEIEQTKYDLLKNISVLQVDSIPVHYYLNDDYLGDGSTKYLFDSESTHFLIASNQDSEMQLNRIAKLLVRIYGSEFNQVEFALTKSLKPSITDLIKLLDDHEIKSFTYETTSIEYDEDEIAHNSETTIAEDEVIDDYSQESQIQDQEDKSFFRETDLTPSLFDEDLNIAERPPNENTSTESNSNEPSDTGDSTKTNTVKTILKAEEIQRAGLMDDQPVDPQIRNNGESSASSTDSKASESLQAKPPITKQGQDAGDILNESLSDSREDEDDIKTDNEVSPLDPNPNRFNSTETDSLSLTDEELEDEIDSYLESEIKPKNHTSGRERSKNSDDNTESDNRYLNNSSRKNRNLKGRAQSKDTGKRLLTYVTASEVEDNNNFEGIIGEKDSDSLRIGKLAVDFVLEFEKKAGRNPIEMSHNNKGYDIISDSINVRRHIEVKGIDGPWNKTGVKLSPSQFKFCLDHPNANFWLYIVEHVGTSQSKIYQVYKPFDKVTGYMFDSGWKDTVTDGESKTAPNELPKINDKVYQGRTYLGRVTAIKPKGRSVQISIKNDNGVKTTTLLHRVTIVKG